jgi:hypothetical protein
MRQILSLIFIALCPALLAAKPNIILIYTDDHGHADLGIHGVVNDIKTPHLDALARSGVVATRTEVTSPVTTILSESAMKTLFGLRENEFHVSAAADVVPAARMIRPHTRYFMMISRCSARHDARPGGFGKSRRRIGRPAPFHKSATLFWVWHA